MQQLLVLLRACTPQPDIEALLLQVLFSCPAVFCACHTGSHVTHRRAVNVGRTGISGSPPDMSRVDCTSLGAPWQQLLGWTVPRTSMHKLAYLSKELASTHSA
jgi:hypothetical protein